MVEKVFFCGVTMDLSKVTGRKETRMLFETEEEAQAFIEKVKVGDGHSILQLKHYHEVYVDDYDIDNMEEYGEWQVEE